MAQLVHRHSGGTILVVDDDAVMCRTLCRLLKGHGYEVHFASDGSQAINRAESEPPDLVLLDLNLPDIDGLLVCQALRADPRTAHIPIIVLTARDGVENERKSRAAGASEYVSKPFDVHTLLGRVNLYITSQRVGGN
ncbi:MAG: response regulator [Chloroflexota bacterium]|nr:MAG: response regulator [Chloroflexota bacterium]